MQLLRVTYSANPSLGGVAAAVKLQQKALKGHGINVTVITCDNPESPWLQGLPDILALGPNKLSYGYTPNLIPWLKENIKNFDAVVIDGLWQYHSFATWRILRKLDIPYYVFPHGMLGPWFKDTYPLKHLKKWLYWPWAEYKVLRDAKRVIYTCEEEKNLARESFFLYKAVTRVASLGVESPPLDKSVFTHSFFEKNPELLTKRIILFLGRIHEIKGLDLLIEAFAEVVKLDSRLHLIIAGPDPQGLVASLKEQAYTLGVDKHISWFGMLNGTDKWETLYSAEVFCLPSHHENFGVVVAEAMSCGLPVIISNKVNIWREVKSDSAGLVDEDSIEGTARSLKAWLDLPEGKASSMSLNAIECFKNRYHINTATKQLIKVLRES